MDYSRIKYFDKTLSDFQDTTQIPEEIISQILAEIHHINDDTYKNMICRVGGILNKLNLLKYHDHIPAIIYRLNSVTPPIISHELEIKLKHMFLEIQAPFNEAHSPDRKNFLPFHYVLIKFFELLELDEFRAKARILKNPASFLKHDKIWQNICQILEWKYITSILI